MMTDETTKEEISNDELLCPITLELFRDPVRAKDGHVYERQAITRWILQHGTSPLTREPLKINDLVPDDRLKNLARARRNSTVSYNSHHEQIILPPLQRLSGYSYRIAPAEVSISRRNNNSSHKHCRGLVFIIFLCILIPICITITVIFFTKTNQGRIISVYYGELTNNSLTFNRLNSSSFGQYYYDNIGIHVSKDSFYEFRSESSINMFGYLYENSFNSTDLNSNLLIFDDDSGISNQFYFRYPLQSNMDYILIATTYSTSTTGTFTIKTRGPSTVQFN